MFEKEAEEWVKENMDCCKTDNSVNQSIPYFDEEERCCAKSAFQDGAEFGYNKANEWHYMKDGISPTHSYRVLVFTDEGVGFGIYGLDDKKWHTYDTGFEVIAWKEIVLPKESE